VAIRFDFDRPVDAKQISFEVPGGYVTELRSKDDWSAGDS